jgi:hypothetical protein
MAMIIASNLNNDGQFEDAPEDLQDMRTPHAYIDTFDPNNDNNDHLDWSDSSKDENDSDEIYDDNRVEDEDWENAERGNHFQKYPSLFPDKIKSIKISQNNIIAFDSMSPCAQAMLKALQRLIISL